ncbi:MAG: polyprenyl synthetase family protein [Candidatus Omnitrophota bacterium]
MDILAYKNNMQKLIDQALNGYFQPEAEIPKNLIEAMRYSIFNGGEHWRALFCIASGETIGGKAEALMPVACAIEFIYTGFMIHAGLAATGNEDYCCGKLSNHKVFGENMAITAGDCFLTAAFSILSRDYNEPKLALSLIQELSKSIGMTGMVAGQVVDMFSRGKSMDKDVLAYICMHKTGELINAAVRTGAIVAGAKEKELEVLVNYSKNIGQALHIFNDLRDAENKKKTSKSIDGNIVPQKMTYVGVYGQRKSREMARKHISRAKDCLRVLESPDLLCQLADCIADMSLPV